MKDYNASIEMNVHEPDISGFLLVSFKGELDKAGLEVIKDDLNNVSEDMECKFLVFDFSELNFINSEGIGFLMTIHYRLSKKEKELVIIGAAEHVYDVLKVIGLLSVIRHFKTMDEFKAGLS